MTARLVNVKGWYSLPDRFVVEAPAYGWLARDSFSLEQGRAVVFESSKTAEDHFARLFPMGKLVEKFTDGSLIAFDCETKNHTVVGSEAHRVHMRRMAERRGQMKPAFLEARLTGAVRDLLWVVQAYQNYKGASMSTWNVDDQTKMCRIISESTKLLREADKVPKLVMLREVFHVARNDFEARHKIWMDTPIHSPDFAENRRDKDLASNAYKTAYDAIEAARREAGLTWNQINEL